MSQQPAHKIRIGNVSAIIWRNTAEKGPWYSCQLQRSYKNSDGEWRNTEALGQDDLLPAAKLLDQAFDWINEAMQADRKAKKEAEQSQAAA